MRYEGGFKTPPRSVETPAFPGTAANGSPPRDAAADADARGGPGPPGAAARRFLSPSSAADARALARRSASLKKRSLHKRLLLRETTTTEPNDTERRVDAETARRLGLKTAEERAAARSLAWRRAVVRFASCCALAAAHERRDALEPLTSRLRRAAIAANRARTRRVGRGKRQRERARRSVARRRRERSRVSPSRRGRGGGRGRGSGWHPSRRGRARRRDGRMYGR